MKEKPGGVMYKILVEKISSSSYTRCNIIKRRHLLILLGMNFHIPRCYRDIVISELIQLGFLDSRPAYKRANHEFHYEIKTLK